MSEIHANVSVGFCEPTDLEVVRSHIDAGTGRTTGPYSKRSKFIKMLSDLHEIDKDIEIHNIQSSENDLRFSVSWGNVEEFLEYFREALDRIKSNHIVFTIDDSKTGTMALMVWEDDHYFDYATGEGEEQDDLVMEMETGAQLINLARKMCREDKERSRQNLEKYKSKENSPIKELLQSMLTIYFTKKNNLKYNHVSEVTKKVASYGWYIRCYNRSGTKLKEIKRKGLANWFTCIGTKDSEFDLMKLDDAEYTEELARQDKIAMIEVGTDYEFSAPDHCSEEVRKALHKCLGFVNCCIFNDESMQSKELLSVFAQLLGREMGCVFENDNEKQFWLI